MLYSQLSVLKEILDNRQLSSVANFFNSISENSKITTSKFAIMTFMNITLATKVLKVLVDKGLMTFHFAVRCSQCGLLLNPIDSPVDLDKEVFCYNCEEEIPISTDDVEVFYTLITPPFVIRQQNNNYELVRAAVKYDDSLTRFLSEGLYDFNRIFYSPSDEDYLN